MKHQGVHAVQFDTVGFDVIAWDKSKILFKQDGPIYIQLKLRMSKKSIFTSQGHNKLKVDKIKDIARSLGVKIENCYFCVAFAKDADIRTVQFYLIPFIKLHLFYTTGTQYRFTNTICLAAAEKNEIVKI
jgi:hypothetical protein